MEGNVFVNRSTGVVARVTAVDSSYARIETIIPPGNHYSMPIAQYDSEFARVWRPATPEDLHSLTTGEFRPPANTDEVWGAQPVDIAD